MRSNSSAARAVGAFSALVETARSTFATASSTLFLIPDACAASRPVVAGGDAAAAVVTDGVPHRRDVVGRRVAITPHTELSLPPFLLSLRPFSVYVLSSLSSWIRKM